MQTKSVYQILFAWMAIYGVLDNYYGRNDCGVVTNYR